MSSLYQRFIIPFLLIFSLTGCGSDLDNFNDVRDFIIKESGNQFRTNLELSFNTDNLGVIKDYLDDIDIDAENYKINSINKIEIGIYKSDDDKTIHIPVGTLTINPEKFSRRLKRAGYDTIVHNFTDTDVSLGVIKTGRGSKKGTAYFLKFDEDQFVLVRIEGDFKKL